MSASLGTWLGAAAGLGISTMVEKLDGVALESSNGWMMPVLATRRIWARLCAERADESIDVSKALDINEQFLISRRSRRHR